MSIFSSIYWSFVYIFFGGTSIPVFFLPIYNTYKIRIPAPSQIYNLQIVSPHSLGDLFISWIGYFDTHKLFKFS